MNRYLAARPLIAAVALLVAACAADDSSSVPAAPDTSVPETSVPVTTVPVTTAPVTTAPETTVPVTTVPETTVPETTVPATTGPPETTVPDVPETTVPGSGIVEFSFSFETDAEGWVVDFADLPTDYDQSIYELDSGHHALPDGLEGAGVHVQGHNRSDDLFMYLKRRVDGLSAGASYRVSVTVDLATNVGVALVGIGGSPGESVFVKAGASTVEPEAAPDSIDHLRMNIDKGNQSQGGSQMVVLGDVANPDVAGEEFRLKTLDHAGRDVIVEADASGGAWLIVGTDSGFEGLTRLYYDRISYTLTPVEQE